MSLQIISQLQKNPLFNASGHIYQVFYPILQNDALHKRIYNFILYYSDET